VIDALLSGGSEVRALLQDRSSERAQGRSAAAEACSGAPASALSDADGSNGLNKIGGVVGVGGHDAMVARVVGRRQALRTLPTGTHGRAPAYSHHTLTNLVGRCSA